MSAIKLGKSAVTVEPVGFGANAVGGTISMARRMRMPVRPL